MQGRARLAERTLARGRHALSLPYPHSRLFADGDVAGLLEALGIDAAHVVGSSMAGMFAQMVAVRHPERVLTLTSIMSTTGDQEVGGTTPEMHESLFTPTRRTEAATPVDRRLRRDRLDWSLRRAARRKTAARNRDRSRIMKLDARGSRERGAVMNSS